jgi:tRNA nucleotidyltransferase (CCA-adding enzyme)
MTSLDNVCAQILERVTPNAKERTHILTLAENLRRKVIETAKEVDVKAEVRVEGSVAKDTWLRKEPDIDIFMRVPTTMPRESFGTICLEIARKATEGYRQIERFAEHPYLEAVVDAIKVNIVPCYKVKQGEWISATDRTPFHTDYVKPLLNEKTCGEIRLLKKFMEGIGVYGAEIKIGGLSGYLCELLTLNYRFFTNVLKSFADWKERKIIDIEGYYKERKSEVKKIFEEPLIIIDPVDRGRNAAAAVRKERLDELIVAARAFLKNPHHNFFYPPALKAFDVRKLAQTIAGRGSALIFIKFGKVKAVPDVLWGQLYKSQRSLRKMLKQYDFEVLYSDVWSNEENLNTFIFELERRFLPPLKKHLGPPIEKRNECEKFLLKHLKSPNTTSGPYLENGRWIVEIKRKYVDIVSLFLDKLADGGRRIGVAELISQAIKDNFEVLANEEVKDLYLSDTAFAKFLTAYLERKPKWLS